MLTRLRVTFGSSTRVDFEAFMYNYTEEHQVAIVYIRGNRHLTVNRFNTEYSKVRKLTERAMEIAKERGDKVSVVSTELPLDSNLAKDLLGIRYDEFMLEIRGEA